MGNSPSSVFDELKHSGGIELSVSEAKIKSKEVPKLFTRLKVVPSNIHNLANLTMIDLSNNKIQDIPATIVQHTNLKALILSNNALTDFPMHLLSIPSLERLSINNNQLTAFQYGASFLHPPLLQELHLSGNNLTAFPTPICSLLHLRILDLSSNQFTVLPPQISKLSSLTSLFLSRNKFIFFPPEVFSFSLLEHLDLSENEICEVSDFPPHGFSSLRNLELQHNSLPTLPTQLCAITTLTILKLHDNKISYIPDEIDKLANLNAFYLQENLLSSLPAGICNLLALRKLYLEYNKIATLPADIKKLTNLSVLILHHNQLKTIPDELHGMKHLLRLSLDDNLFSEEASLKIKTEGTFGVLQEKDNAFMEMYACLPDKITRDDANLSKLSGYDTLKRSGLFKNQTHTISRSLFRNDNANNRGSVDLSTLFARGSPVKGELPADNIISNTPASPTTRKKVEDVPSNSKIKVAFDNLLEEQDFSKKKKETLQKLSKEQKWSLLTQYKASTLELLKKEKPEMLNINFTLRRNVRPVAVRTPKDYCSALAALLLPPLRTMRELHIMLTEGGSDVSVFIDIGGIDCLVKMMQNAIASSNLSALYGGQKCMKSLLDVGLRSVLTTMHSIDVALQSLLLLVRNEPTSLAAAKTQHQSSSLSISSDSLLPVDVLLAMAVTDFLRDIISVPVIGVQAVMLALDSVRVTNLLPSKFHVIIEVLKSKIDNDIKAAVMHILNLLVEGAGGATGNMEARFAIECQLISCGMLDTIKDLWAGLDSAILVIEFDIFLQILDDDEQGMVCKFGRKEVLKLLGHDLTAHDNIARVVVGLDNGKCGQCVSIPVTKTTRCKEIIEEVVAKFPEFKEKQQSGVEYGLFLPDLSQAGVWVDLEKNFSDCSLQSEVLEFKMKEIGIRLKVDNSIYNITIAPYLSVGELSDTLRVKYVPTSMSAHFKEDIYTEECGLQYGMYLHNADNEAEGVWLEETKKLLDYNTTGKVLGLKLKQQPLRILFGNTFQTLLFDPNSSIATIVEVLSNKLLTNSKQHIVRVQEYGLYIENQRTMPTQTNLLDVITGGGTCMLLEETKLLCDYYIPKQSWLKFQHKCKPIVINVCLTSESDVVPAPVQVTVESTRRKYQKITPNLDKVPVIRKFLESLPKIEEKDLFKMSLECEPRGLEHPPPE